MNFVIMISTLTFVALGVILWQITLIKHRYEVITEILDDIADQLEKTPELFETAVQTEKNTIHALENICEALNLHFKNSNEYMNMSAFTLRQLAICMIPIISEYREVAVEDEEYEKAQELVNILYNLQNIINPQQPQSKP